jgi:hypothetical protein
MAAQFDHDHRDTLEMIFSHSSRGNIEWRQVLSLLEATGTAREKHDGKLTLGPESEVIQPPRVEDIDEQLLADQPRMLRNAGFAPAGS